MLREFYREVARADLELRPPGDPRPTDIFSQNVNLRGALTLHALRLRVGDEVFFEILRTYSEDFRYSNATSLDFFNIAEDISQEKLEDLFEAWLYQQKIPDIQEMELFRSKYVKD